MIINIKNNVQKIKIPKKRTRILVIGDLNIDIIFQGVQVGENRSFCPEIIVGGTGINASIAFKRNNYTPILFGKVGHDYYGDLIIKKLKSQNIISIIEIDKKKPTCLCNIIYFENKDYLRTIFFDNNNTNDYDILNLSKALEIINLNIKDYVFLTLHFILRLNKTKNNFYNFYSEITKTKAKIIIDLTPHDIYKHISKKELNYIFSHSIFAVIGEHNTFMKILNTNYYSPNIDNKPKESEYLEIEKYFNSEYYLCRFGNGNISFQSVYYITKQKKIIYLEKNKNTGYDLLLDYSTKRGFGDILTSNSLTKIIKYSYKKL